VTPKRESGEGMNVDAELKIKGQADVQEAKVHEVGNVSTPFLWQ
jgi:hypothetical protein